MKNNKNNILLDADNLFWAISPRQSESDIFIPASVFSLYEKVKYKLSREIEEFRFGQELTAIYIDPTDKCNASCSYCYIPAKTRQSGRSMTREELDFILNKLAKYFKGSKRKQVIIFHASEPLLVKDIIFEAIQRYKKIFKFGIQTNAILMEKKDIIFLKKHRVGVGISLDSFLPSTNDRLRASGRRESRTQSRGSETKGNFAQAVRAIEWFDGYKGLNIIATVTKLNVNDMPGLVKFLHARKVPCVLLNPVRFTRASMKALRPDDKTLAEYFIKAVDTAVELSSKSKHKIIIGNFTNTILAIIAPLARRLMCDISPCGGGRCFFTITARGSMIPCGEFTGLKEFSGGNIFRDSIPKAMQSKAFKEIRKRAVENIPECNTCALRNICGAPCPAELHSLGNMYPALSASEKPYSITKGGMYQKSVFCNFYKEVIKYAFKMIAEDKIKYILRDDSPDKLEYAYNLSLI